jgi:hypothetical protein
VARGSAILACAAKSQACFAVLAGFMVG